jgi:hypothetical protein
VSNGNRLQAARRPVDEAHGNREQRQPASSGAATG